jgi:hypothetical protein
MQYFPHSWHSTFTVHVAKLTRFEFLLFIKSQFTRYAPNVFTSISVRRNASDHELSHSFKFPSTVAKCFDSHHECVDEVSLPFQLKLNILGFLNIHPDKSLKNWIRGKLFADVYWYERFSLFWCGKLTAESLSKHFRYTIWLFLTGDIIWKLAAFGYGSLCGL